MAEAAGQGAGSGAAGTAHGQHLSRLDRVAAAIDPKHFVTVVSVEPAAREDPDEAADYRRIRFPQSLDWRLRRAGAGPGGGRSKQESGKDRRRQHSPPPHVINLPGPRGLLNPRQPAGYGVRTIFSASRWSYSS
jgi:hypothetical protein